MGRNQYQEVHDNASKRRQQHEWRMQTQGQWWNDTDIWEERFSPSDLSRPCEDKALNNIFMLTMMKAGKYRLVLTELELDIDTVFTRYKRARSGYPEIHYIQQTAMYLRMPVFQVRSILQDIENVKRNIASYEDFGLDALPVAS